MSIITPFMTSQINATITEADFYLQPPRVTKPASLPLHAPTKFENTTSQVQCPVRLSTGHEYDATGRKSYLHIPWTIWRSKGRNVWCDVDDTAKMEAIRVWRLGRWRRLGVGCGGAGCEASALGTCAQRENGMCHLRTLVDQQLSWAMQKISPRMRVN